MSELNYYQKAVIENAKWIDGILLTGVTIGGVSIGAKLFGVADFEFYDLKLSVELNWSIFIILTLAHLYVTWLLNREIFRLWVTHSSEKCEAVFEEIRATGGIFVRGLSPRTNVVKSFKGIDLYEMKLSDPSTWITHLFALLIIVAIIPFDLSNLSSFLGKFLTAIIIIAANWLIGSMWLVPLSELAIPKEESKLLSRRKELDKKAPIKRKGFSPLILKGILPVLSIAITCAGGLLAFFAISSIGALYAYVNSLGWGLVFIKSVVALTAITLILFLTRKLLKLKRLGKFALVVVNTILIGGVLAGYVAWVR